MAGDCSFRTRRNSFGCQMFVCVPLECGWIRGREGRPLVHQQLDATPPRETRAELS